MRFLSALIGICFMVQPVQADDAALNRAFKDAFEASNLVAVGAGFQTGSAAPILLNAGQVSKTDTRRVPLEAPWHIGSITKSFTAVLGIMLVEEGQLSLDARLAEMLPDEASQMNVGWQDITLREILSHTAGLPANPTRKQMIAGAEGLTAQALLEAHWTGPLPKPRGEFLYSNLGYVLAGKIIEQAAGAPWESVLHARITGPLGMTSVGLGPPETIYGHRSFLFRTKPIAPTDKWSDNPPFLSPAGRLHVSVADMLTFGRFLLDACAGRSPLLSQAACEAMMAPVTESYALGFVRYRLKELDALIIGHDGSNGMWLANLVLIPERDTAAFIATNAHAPRKLTKIGTELLGVYFGE